MDIQNTPATPALHTSGHVFLTSAAYREHRLPIPPTTHASRIAVMYRLRNAYRRDIYPTIDAAICAIDDCIDAPDLIPCGSAYPSLIGLFRADQSFTMRDYLPLEA